MKLIPVAAVVLAFAAICSHAAAQSPMRPGNWETTMEMDMPGMPMKMPPMKTARCVTQQEIDSPNRGLPSGPQKNPNDCKITDYKQSGNMVSWNVACSGQQPMTGSGELKFNGDAYDGIVKMMMNQQQMTMKMAGKRLGDCAK
jgi:hypothetical protein